jgi:tRNA-dihydrouridine synthase B
MVKIGTVEIGEFPLLLAPMEDISDPPFRRLCKKYGADLVYSEFISSEGLIRNALKSVHKMDISDEERPVAIQIFGSNESSMQKAVEIVEEAGPDIIDINFGCPVKKVISKGAGAAALKDIPSLIRMAKIVVQSTKLPVTVKTRLGWDQNSICIEEVAEKLQDVGIKAIAIHARTAKQMYSGSADWTRIGKVTQNHRIKIPVFGNGDIDSPVKALEIKNQYPVDGIMIGRATVGNPWLFREIKHYLNKGQLLPLPGLKERVDICRTHLSESIKWKGEKVGIHEMRKHYKHYFKGFADFKLIRLKLILETDIQKIENILMEIENIAVKD